MAEAYFDLTQHLQMLDSARQELEQEKQDLQQRQERLAQMTKPVADAMAAIDAARNVSAQYIKLQEEMAALRQQLDDERRQREELEMKLAEMNKLSAGMAKKTSEEAMLKALRTYANTSKRKTIDKRIFAKTAILEMANVNGLTLPPDLAATIDALDDEQAEPKTSVTVNAGGNYNDIHNNTTVNQKQ